MTKGEIQELFRKLAGKYNGGTYFVVSSDWVKENDEGVYDTLLEMLEEFASDESNACSEKDVENFTAGEWDVEYLFRPGETEDEIEVSVTAGRDGQMLANQPAWFTEDITVQDVEKGYTSAPIEKYAKLIDY